MRRLILAALAFTAVCQGQGVSRAGLPPQNAWMALLPICLSGMLGAGGVLIGVWLAGRRRAAENAANRQNALDVERLKAEIAAKGRSQDLRWAFRKDVYSNLSLTIAALIESSKQRRSLLQEHRPIPESLQQEILAQIAQLRALANLASLAIGESVMPSLRSVVAHASTVEGNDCGGERLQELSRLQRLVHQTSRQEIWGTAENKVERGAARRSQP